MSANSKPHVVSVRSGHWKRLVCVGLVVPALTGGVAACSSSGGKSGATPSDVPTGSVASAAPTSSASGTPINITVIGSGLTSFGADYTSVIQTVEAAVAQINAGGGIKNHPIKLTTCVDNLDPNNV
jgi:hypothetical protein